MTSTPTATLAVAPDLAPPQPPTPGGDCERPDRAALALRRVDNHRRPDMAETWLDTGTGARPGQVVVLLRDHWDRPWITSHAADQWWLLADGTPVAYLHTMEHRNRTEYRHVLCDIEVRPGYRGRGYARRIVEAANAVLATTLHTTGGFTPLGAQALSWLPVLPWEAPGVKYDDQAFVADWDTLSPVARF